MSRSYRKNNFSGITTCTSEKTCKFFAHKRLRQSERLALLRCMLEEDPETPLFEVYDELGNLWTFRKDGKHFFSEKEFIELFGEEEGKKMFRQIKGK